MPARRCLPALLALALVVPALSSCQLLGGGSSLDDALEVVPGDAVQVTFLDRAASAERTGTDELETGADDGDLDDYVDAMEDDPVGGTPLAQYLAPMQDAAFSELDVQWWVAAAVEDDAPVDVYKVEDVELDALVGELEEAGFESETRDGRTLLTAGSPVELVDPESGLIDGRYPPVFGSGVLVDPDEDLVAVGAEVGRVVEVLDDDEDSLVDSGGFDELTDGVEDVELAYLAEDPPCGSNRSSEEAIAASGIGELGTPDAIGYFVGGEEATTSGRLLFGDDDAAGSDLDARTTYLEEGRSLRTAQPVSDLGSADLDQDGSLVTMELDLEDPTAGRQMAQEADAFFACAP